MAGDGLEFSVLQGYVSSVERFGRETAAYGSRERIPRPGFRPFASSKFIGSPDTRDVQFPREGGVCRLSDIGLTDIGGAGRPRYMRVFQLTAFLELGLSEPIIKALTDEQYVTPTPIQAQTIPQVLQGLDVVGIAQTGTGKTAAFALPILNHLSGNRSRPLPRSCRVLVLSPTRELSAQIVDSFKTYGRYLRPSVALAIGGVNINPQMRALQHGVDVLVATPGRLLDLMDHRAVTLDRVEVFVLDEADRMLDMGFIQDIRKIVKKLPAKRQTLFFSATMPREITELANTMLSNPVRVSVTPAATTVERIDQRVILVDRGAKPALLAQLLRSEPIDRVLVFTRTKHGADKVVRSLATAQISAEAIHGNKSQNQRERVLAAFRAGKVRTLVATDIAARGIDVEGISHVVNFDLPNIPESYVHRIGRTARAGADGIAISFCDAEERAYLRDIEKLIRIKIPSTDQRGVRQTEPRPAETRSAQPHAAQADLAQAHATPSHAEQPRAARSNGNGAHQQRQPDRDTGKPHGQRAHQKRRGAPPQRNGAPNGHAAPQNGRHQPSQRNGGQHNGGQPSGGQPSGGRRNGGQPNGQQQRSPAQDGGDASIATVAFLRPTQKHKHRSHAGDHGARRGTR
jgi:ATP-dependent RNA helicase RhlE